MLDKTVAALQEIASLLRQCIELHKLMAALDRHNSLLVQVLSRLDG